MSSEYYSSSICNKTLCKYAIPALEKLYSPIMSANHVSDGLWLFSDTDDRTYSIEIEDGLCRIIVSDKNGLEEARVLFGYEYVPQSPGSYIIYFNDINGLTRIKEQAIKKLMQIVDAEVVENHERRNAKRAISPTGVMNGLVLNINGSIAAMCSTTGSKDYISVNRRNGSGYEISSCNHASPERKHTKIQTDNGWKTVIEKTFANPHAARVMKRALDNAKRENLSLEECVNELKQIDAIISKFSMLA